MERSLQIISTAGRMGFIVPISAYSSPRFDDLRKLLANDLDRIWVASFANRPAQLFKGAQKRLNIILGRKGSESPKYFTTEYIRWKSNERSQLFAERMKFVENPLISQNADTFFKSGCSEDIEILRKIGKFRGSEPWARHSKPVQNGLFEEQGNKIYFTRAFGYFLYFLDFIVEYRQMKTGAKVLPSEFHCLEMNNPRHTSAAVAVLNSSLFYWFLSQTTDCRNVNFKEVLDFPLDLSGFDDLTIKQLSKAGDKLLKKIKSSSFYTQKSGLRIQTFDYLSCIAEIENCDVVVLKAYGIDGKSAARIRSFDANYRFSKEGKRRNGAVA
jgi:hypothetical protein